MRLNLRLWISNRCLTTWRVVPLTGIEKGQINERFFPREGKRRERILKQGEVCLHYTFVPQPNFIQLDFRGGWKFTSIND